MKERAENRLRVTMINRMSTEEQLNARRKGIPHKSKVKVKTADVAKENRERKEKDAEARRKLAEMKIGEEDPEKFDELLGQLNDDHEGIDQYIARVEWSYMTMRMMASAAQSKPGTKLHLGMPGNPLRVDKKLKEGAAKMLKIFGTTFERECPKFHDEYWRTMGIPDGLDKEWARKVLYRAYLDARMLPWFNLGTWRMLGDDGKNVGLEKGVISEKDLIKRWRGTPPFDELTSGNLQFGTIIDRRQGSVQ